MSASNWTVCPRCWDKAQRTAESLRSSDFRTFREDYEFYGAADGVVVASYTGRCKVCGLSVELHESKRFYGGQTDPGRGESASIAALGAYLARPNKVPDAERIVQRLRDVSRGDAEQDHIYADQVLVEELERLTGNTDTIRKAFMSIHRWYA